MGGNNKYLELYVEKPTRYIIISGINRPDRPFFLYKEAYSCWNEGRNLKLETELPSEKV